MSDLEKVAAEIRQCVLGDNGPTCRVHLNTMRSWANTIEQACKATVALDVSLEKARALHRVGTEDTLGYRSLCKAVDDVNTGKVMLLCGKVVSVEGKEGE